MSAGPWCSSSRRVGWGSRSTGLGDAFGPDRAAVVCRELTKTHEEIIRGSLGELARWAQKEVLGEITVVVGGAPDPRAAAATLDPTEAAQAAVEGVAAAQAAGMSRSEALAATAAKLGLRKREVYDAVVAAKHAEHSFNAKQP